jgi:hypothetical protein
MAGISGISSIQSSALVGIQRASASADRAAASIVSSGVGATDPVTISPEARAFAAASGGDDLASSLVNLDAAKHTLAAQVSVLHAADDMSNDLLNIVGKSNR